MLIRCREEIVLPADVCEVAVHVTAFGGPPNDEPMMLHQDRRRVFPVVDTDNGANDGAWGKEGERRRPPVRAPVEVPVRAGRRTVSGSEGEVWASAVPGMVGSNYIPGPELRIGTGVARVRETRRALSGQRRIDLVEPPGRSMRKFPPWSAGNLRSASGCGHDGRGTARPGTGQRAVLSQMAAEGWE